MITAAMQSKQRKVTITCFVIICTELLIIVYLWSSQKDDVIVRASIGQPLQLRSVPTLGDVLNFQLKSPLLVTTVNHAFLGLLVNLLISIQRINLQPNSNNSSRPQPLSVFVICEDKMSFDELSKNPPNISLKYVTALSHLEESVSTNAIFASKVYLKLVQKRVSYIELLLRNNIDVLYVDSDVVLLDDPFKYFNGTEDLFIQRESEKGSVCTGFFFMRANNITRQFVSAWKSALPKDKRGNQPTFNQVLTEFQKQIKVKRLPVDRFASGNVFMASNLTWQRRNPRPVEVHANFLRGIDQKIAMLKRYDLWFSTSKYEKE